jgi:spermidine synthase
MTILLDRRDDGTLRLYIDGDLQFDSRDERIYHELLALPALALAERRTSGPLRALICGGGDGLTARELLKSERLAHIDLVDYDPAIIDLARDELAGLNQRSLDHIVTHVHVEDAWAFSQRAAQRGRSYHLIVVDLTVPQDIAGAQLYSVDWYQQLAALLGEQGVLAVNAASPSGAPQSYWSIYNSMRSAGFHPRPYRVALPSFADMGYGNDWGFILASATPISAAELDDALPLVAPRHALQSPAQLRQLFHFPAGLAELRATALPARAGSDILLHYFYNSSHPQADSAETWDGLAEASDSAPLPAPDAGRHLLPPELRAALAAPVGAAPDEEALLQHVLQLMPALQRNQTRTMIAAFLEDPARFLGALDLPGLVERLLRRAAELPGKLVEELRLLRLRLREFAGDHEQLLRLGMRVVTIVTLVVIIANLTFPDMTYGKGGDGGTSAGHAYTGDTVRLSQPGHSYYDSSLPPSVATNGGFRATNIGHGAAVDEVGTLFPTRRYRYYPYSYGRSGYLWHRSHTHSTDTASEDESAYRLTPETDILNDGKVVVALNDTAYLLIASDLVSVIDMKSGEPILFLQRDPALAWRAAKEIERQQRGLDQTLRAKQAWITWAGWMSFGPGFEDDRLEMANVQAMVERLGAARQSLGAVSENVPNLPTPPVAGSFEVFTGVWLLLDGSGLALQLPDGLAFMDASGLYRDQQRTQPLDEPYPQDFKAFIVSYLQQEIKDRDATLARLNTEFTTESADLLLLQSDEKEYNAIRATSPESEIVEYGTSNITLGDALRLTAADIARVQQRLALLQAQINSLPGELAAAERLVIGFK